MRTISITEMSSKGISGALRQATEEPILVSREGEPFVFIVDAAAVLGMGQGPGSSPEVSARQLLAVHLFDQGTLSIGRGARLAGLGVSEFVNLCDRLQIPILRQPAEELEKEVDDFEAWLDQAI